jgi:3-methylcrotonyl-CoA carboxylase alpha subunit
MNSLKIKAHDVSVKYTNNSPVYEFRYNNKTYKVELIDLDKKNRIFYCDIDGHRIKFSYYKDKESKDKFFCYLNDNSYEFEINQPAFVRKHFSADGADSAGGEADSKYFYAPMPGVIDKISVKKGDAVNKGDVLLSMVAMKMEYVIRAGKSGVVDGVHCTAGQNVKKGMKLVTVEVK